MACEPTRVFTKRELLRDVWDFQSTPRTRTIDTHASRVRRKLAAAGATPAEWVINHQGVGYALVRPQGISTEAGRNGHHPNGGAAA